MAVGSNRVVGPDPELTGLGGEPSSGIVEALLAFQERLGVWGFVDHEGTEPPTSPDRVVLFQMAVGACDGAGCDSQLGGKVADRRQPAAGFEATDCDHDGQLGPELFEAGHGAAVVQAQDEASGEAVLVGEADSGTLEHRCLL